MNIDDLLLNIKAVSFDSLVCQKDIKTEEDKERYAQKGYRIFLTVDEFKDRFEVDPGCVWYTPSVSQESLYFNSETLAAGTFPMEFLLSELNIGAGGRGPGTREGVISGLSAPAGLPSETRLRPQSEFANSETDLKERGTWAEKFYRNIEEIERQVAGHDYMHAIMSLPDAMQLEYFNKLIEKKGSDIPGLYELFFSFYTNSDYGFRGVTDETLKAVLSTKTEEDIAKTKEALEGLPEVVKIYRGGNSASTPFEEAMSWTLDVNVATFFACRRGKDEGYVVEAEVSKKDIIDAFLDDRDEQEIIVDPTKVRVLQERSIHGIWYLNGFLPKVISMYLGYKDKLMNLEFAQDSVDHGYGHEARVMLLSLLIAEHEKLPLRDREILATAALYHDLQRVNDIDDPQHGRDGREYYHNTVANPDPLVEFLCEYHCRPDEDGYQEIRNNRNLSKNRSRAKLLIDIFKDADALDRCRFGLRDLDVNQLRLPISKELPLVAKICYEQIKVPERKRTMKRSLDDQIVSAEEKKCVKCEGKMVEVEIGGR